MKIAVLSGKGGTGKTLVAVNLASVADNSMYIDCDVEEPNGHLFFKPTNVQKKKVFVKIPVVCQEHCDGCRKCVDFCKFNALAYIKEKLIVFDKICHSCGGCVLICPQKAMKEKERVIGTIEHGISDKVIVETGILETGEESGVPIIKELLNNSVLDNDYVTFIDCPPGSACAVMESIMDADYCVLVAEPTIFGVHNLNMVYELVRLFNKPFGVVLNKCLEEENPAEKFCKQKGIKILSKIPFDNELGIMNSNAIIAAKKSYRLKKLFSALLQSVIKEIEYETTVNS